MVECSDCGNRTGGACYYSEDEQGVRTYYCIPCYRKIHPIEGDHYSTFDAGAPVKHPFYGTVKVDELPE